MDELPCAAPNTGPNRPPARGVENGGPASAAVGGRLFDLALGPLILLVFPPFVLAAFVVITLLEFFVLTCLDWASTKKCLVHALLVNLVSTAVGWVAALAFDFDFRLPSFAVAFAATVALEAVILHVSRGPTFVPGDPPRPFHRSAWFASLLANALSYTALWLFFASMSAK